jgi:hypothetical protein
VVCGGVAWLGRDWQGREVACEDFVYTLHTGFLLLAHTYEQNCRNCCATTSEIISSDINFGLLRWLFLTSSFAVVSNERRSWGKGLLASQCLLCKFCSRNSFMVSRISVNGTLTSDSLSSSYSFEHFRVFDFRRTLWSQERKEAAPKDHKYKRSDVLFG